MKKFKTTFGILAILLLMLVNIGWSAGTTYYSQGNLAVNTLANWNTIRGGGGTSPANFTSSDIFVIQNGHAMTLAATYTWVVTGGTVIIESGGSWQNSSATTVTIPTFTIYGGGTYYHNTGTGTVPGGTKKFANSTNGGNGNGTIEIQSEGSAGIQGAVTWGNVVVNCATTTGSVGHAGAFATIEGSFTMNAYGTYEFRFTNAQTTTHNISGDLIINGGTLNLKSGAGALPVNIGGNLTITGGTLTQSNGTSNITFIGSNKTFTKSAGTLTNTLMNWAVGTGASLKLNNNFSVAASRTLTIDGLLYTQANNLTIDGSISIATPGSTKMIVLDDGTNLGTLNLKVANNQVYPFYVGDTRNGTNFTPAIVTFTAGTTSSSYLAMSMKAQKDVDNYSTTDYLTRSWTFTPTNLPSPSYTMELNYVDGDIQGTETNLWFGKYDGSSWTLLNQPDFNNNKFTSATTLTNFSKFTGGEKGPLPVLLSSFTSNIITRYVKLNWTTSSELNNSGFEIQKSVVSSQQSGDWSKIGYVTGNGTKTTPTNYTFEDKKLNAGKYNYRLKQIDFNGNFEYFNLAGEVEIGVPNKFDISQNYPNPFNPTTKIDFDLPYDSKVSIKLYDISGREVMTMVNEQKPAGYYTVQMNGYNLSSGMYFYQIIAEGNGQKFVSTKKLVLVK